MPTQHDWIYKLYVEELNKKQPQSFYYEDGKMIMTEQYHLERGYCCGSGCRHCPYNHINVPKK